MCVLLCVPHVYLVPTVPEEDIEHLELKLEMVVSCHMGSEPFHSPNLKILNNVLWNSSAYDYFQSKVIYKKVKETFIHI